MQPDEHDQCDGELLAATLRALHGGDQAALARLVEITQRPLRGWVATYASSADMVEQAVQAIYADVLKACRRKDADVDDLPTWFQAIATERMAMELQDRIRFLRFQNEGIERIIAETGLMLLQRAPMPIGRGGEAMDSVDDCLDSLDRHSRRLLAGFYADKRSLNQMANGYRRSRHRVARLLSRMRLRTRRRLAAAGVMP